MYSGKTKSDIQMIISMDFKAAAKKNLTAIKYKGDALYDILIEGPGHELPYKGVDWTRKVKLPKGGLKELQKLIGSNAFELDADEVYREYWLWFMRHAVKLSKKEGEQ